MEELLSSNLEQYKNLMQIKSNLDDELLSVTDIICLYSVQIEICKTIEHPITSTMKIIQDLFPKQFIRNNKDMI